ncbi:hypothetical protein DNTS_008595 [Danionella cerebrum]|uniref:Chromosomal protein D1-like n=1 Tax=Danionella cerebrum TaxID=2873325 RepID=A0A553QRP4_9TELE|nr:hypothetical protein DNTS_008595 [Danionella translucida]
MEVEKRAGSEGSLSNGGPHAAKRGRGRPRGSANKKFTPRKTHTPARTSKKVDYFTPGIVIKTKVKKRGRPKKIRVLGRPRKIPLTPEEESERLLSSKHKKRMSKPLGRPRIHPVPKGPTVKRGRPPKANAKTNRSEANGTFKKRGRPAGSLNKKKGRPVGSTKVTKITSDDKKQVDGIPRKRGRPPGSGASLKPEVVHLNPDGSPRKRGRPSGTPKKLKAVQKAVEEGGKKRGRPPKTVNLTTNEEEKTAKGAMRRKRGRPSKVSLLEPQEKSEDEDSPSAKRSHTSDDSGNANDTEEDGIDGS